MALSGLMAFSVVWQLGPDTMVASAEEIADEEAIVTEVTDAEETESTENEADADDTDAESAGDEAGFEESNPEEGDAWQNAQEEADYVDAAEDVVGAGAETDQPLIIDGQVVVDISADFATDVIYYGIDSDDFFVANAKYVFTLADGTTTTLYTNQYAQNFYRANGEEYSRGGDPDYVDVGGQLYNEISADEAETKIAANEYVYEDNGRYFVPSDGDYSKPSNMKYEAGDYYIRVGIYQGGSRRYSLPMRKVTVADPAKADINRYTVAEAKAGIPYSYTQRYTETTCCYSSQLIAITGTTAGYTYFDWYKGANNWRTRGTNTIAEGDTIYFRPVGYYAQANYMTFSEIKPISSITYVGDKPVTVYEGVGGNTTDYLISENVDYSLFKVEYTDGTTDTIESFSEFGHGYELLYTNDNSIYGSVTAGSYKLRLSASFWYDDNGFNKYYYAPVEVKPFSKLAEDASELTVGEEVSLAHGNMLYYYAIQLEAGIDYTVYLDKETDTTPFMYLYDGSNNLIFTSPTHFYYGAYTVSVAETGTYYIALRASADNNKFAFNVAPGLEQYDGRDIKSVEFDIRDNTVFYGCNTYQSAMYFSRIDITLSDNSHRYLYFYNLYDITQLLKAGINGGFSYDDYYLNAKICVRANGNEGVTYAVDAQGNRYIEAPYASDYYGLDNTKQYSAGTYYIVARFYQQNDSGDALYYSDKFITSFEIVDPANYAGAVSLSEAKNGITYNFYDEYPELGGSKNTNYAIVKGLTPGKIYEYRISDGNRSIPYSKLAVTTYEFLEIDYDILESDSVVLTVSEVTNPIKKLVYPVEIYEYYPVFYQLPDRYDYDVYNLLGEYRYNLLMENGTTVTCENPEALEVGYLHDADGNEYNYNSEMHLTTGQYYVDVVYAAGVCSNGENPQLTVPVTIKSFSDLATGAKAIDFGQACVLDKQPENYLKVELEAGKRYSYAISGAVNTEVRIYSAANQERVCRDGYFYGSSAFFMVEETGTYYMVISQGSIPEGEVSFTVNEPGGVKIDGKKLLDIEAYLPNDVLYRDIDFASTAIDAVRFKLIYENSDEYVYKRDAYWYWNDELVRLNGDNYEGCGLYYHYRYAVKTDKTPEAAEGNDYVDADETVYRTYFSEADIRAEFATQDTIYVIFDFYTVENGIANDFDKTLVCPIQIKNVADDASVNEIEIGQNSNVALRGYVYDYTEEYSYRTVFRINGSKKGYIYGYEFIIMNGADEIYHTSDYFCAKSDNTGIVLSGYPIGDYQRIVKVIEYAPMEKVEYVPAQGDVKPVYYYGIDGIGGSYYYTKYDNLFRLYAHYKITYKSGEIKYVTYNDLHEYLGYASSSVCDAEGKYISDAEQRSLEVGNYFYRVYIGAWLDEVTEESKYIDIPFEVKPASELANDADTLALNQPVAISGYNRGGQYIYFKSYLAAGSTYVLKSTDGYYWAEMYDLGGNLVKDMFNDNRDGEITVTKSGEYIFVINEVQEHYSNRPVVVTLKKQPQIVSALFDATVPYRNLIYMGIDSDWNSLRPKGACIRVNFDDDTEKVIFFDDYNNSNEYYNFLGTYVTKMELVDPAGTVTDAEEVDWQEMTAGSLTVAGTYQVKMYFKNVDEPISIPVEVRDPAQAEVLAVNSSAEIKTGGMEIAQIYYHGNPNVYKVNLEKDKIYSFKFDEIWGSGYMTLWDTEGNAVVDFKYSEYYDSFWNETYTYRESVNYIGYKPAKTGTYYLCVETTASAGIKIAFNEIIPVTKVVLDTARPYLDTLYAGLEMSYSPTGITFDVYYANGTVEKCQYQNSLYNSKVTAWTIVDADGVEFGRYGAFPKAGQYYYVLTIEGYDGEFKVPLTVKSAAASETVSEGYEGVNVKGAAINFINGGSSTGSPVMYKFELEAGKSYYFKNSSYLDGSEIYGRELTFFLMDSELRTVVSGRHTTYDTGGYGTNAYYYAEFVYTPSESGVYYAYISNYLDEDFRFSFYEVPQLASAEIISQPLKTVYLEGIDIINYRWSVGFAVRLVYVDGTTIIARANEMGIYGFNTYMVDEAGDRHELDGADYYSYPCGKYYVSFVEENSGIELNTIELSVVKPQPEVITLGEKVRVISSEDDYQYIELGQSNSGNMFVGDTKLYEITVTEAGEYQIIADKPIDITIYNENWSNSVGTGYMSGIDTYYFNAIPGKYYIKLASEAREFEFSVSKAVKITKAEIVTQPVYVTKGLSVDKADYSISPAGMKLKLTYEDGTVRTVVPTDTYWRSVVSNVKLYSIIDNKYVENYAYSNGCNCTVTKDDTVLFEIVMNSEICATEKLRTNSFKLTTDIYTNNKRAITTANSAANPYCEARYAYDANDFTLKTEKGKRYQLTVEGADAFVELATEEYGNKKYTVIASDWARDGIARCFFDGIAASDGIYTLHVNPYEYDENGKYNVKISLIECNTSAVYEGMSVSLVDGKVRVNAYFSIKDTTNIMKYAGYIGREDCDAPVAETVVINGVSKNVYRFSAYVAPDELNDVFYYVLTYDNITLEFGRICVYDYAKAIIENKGNKPEYTKAKDMLNALLNYGEYMEKYFGTGNFSDPKISYLPTADKAATISSYSLNATKAASFKSSESFSYLGASLVLHEDIALKLYFANNAHVGEDTFMSTYRLCVDGVEDNGSLAVEVYDSYIVVSLYDIDVRKLGTSYTFDIVNKGKTSDAARVVYSPMNYVAEVLNHQDSYSNSFVNLCKALYVYMDEAKKYAA